MGWVGELGRRWGLGWVGKLREREVRVTERERGTDWEMGLGVGRQNLSAMMELETATAWAGR